ncbi:hypothetical protein [Helicobacter pullorum]|nr:hypothetical protein [Helicobacter pullorum]
MKKTKKNLQKALKQIKLLKLLLQWQSTKLEVLKEELEKHKRKHGETL